MTESKPYMLNKVEYFQSKYLIFTKKSNYSKSQNLKNKRIKEENKKMKIDNQQK